LKMGGSSLLWVEGERLSEWLTSGQQAVI